MKGCILDCAVFFFLVKKKMFKVMKRNGEIFFDIECESQMIYSDFK